MLKKALFSLALLVVFLLSASSPFAHAQERVLESWWEEKPYGHPGFLSPVSSGDLVICRNGYREPFVFMLNPRGEVTWTSEPLQANSAVLLENGNLLVAVSGAPGPPFQPRVVEINQAGKIVWEYLLPSRAEAPRFAQRLKNGHTLVVTPRELQIVNSRKEKVWTYRSNTINLVYACFLPNGNYLLVDKGIRGGGKVLEISPPGKVVWQYGNGKYGTAYGQLKEPAFASRSPHGETVIVDLGANWLLKIAPEGKVKEVVSWEEVATNKGISNTWFALPLQDKIYLAVTLTSGRSGILKINEASLKLYLDGEWLYTEVFPIISKGRTFVPLRDVFQALGARVAWEEETKTVTATKQGRIVKLTVGENKAFLNGNEVTLEAPPFLKENRVMVPLRFVSEALGVKVTWEDQIRTISLTSPEGRREGQQLGQLFPSPAP